MFRATAAAQNGAAGYPVEWEPGRGRFGRELGWAARFSGSASHVAASRRPAPPGGAPGGQSARLAGVAVRAVQAVPEETGSYE
jgi:hypothetical protein